jgi:hypothetical protein
MLKSVAFSLFLSSTIILCYQQNSTTEWPFAVLPFQTSPGIFFELLGDVENVIQYYTINVAMDMSQYHQTSKSSMVSKQGLMSKCYHFGLRLQSKCKSWEDHLTQLFNKSDTLHNEIFQHADNLKSRRVKRDFGGHSSGMFNGGGRLFNEIFGVLDDQYAAKIELDFQEVRRSRDQVKVQLGNLTTLLDNTANILMKQQMILGDLSKNYTDLIEKLKDESAMDSMMRYLVEFMGERIRIQGEIRNVLYNTNTKNLNTVILSPQQFETEMIRILNNIDLSKYRLPSLVVNEMYHEIKMEYSIKASTLIFQLKVPLVYPPKFSLYKTYSLPDPTSNHYIASFVDYVMLTSDKMYFYELYASSFERLCRDYRDLYLCTIDYPMYIKRSEKLQCELSILAHENNLDKCAMIETKINSTIIKLNAENEWLFMTRNEATVDINCETTRHIVKLKGVGKLRLTNGCTMFGLGVILQSTKNNLKRNLYIDYLPQYNLSTYMDTYTFYDPKATNETDPILDDINELKKNIENQKNSIFITRLMDASDEIIAEYKSHLILTVVIIAVCLCIGGFIIYRYKNKLHKRFKKYNFNGFLRHISRQRELPTISDDCKAAMYDPIIDKMYDDNNIYEYVKEKSNCYEMRNIPVRPIADLPAISNQELRSLSGKPGHSKIVTKK